MTQRAKVKNPQLTEQRGEDFSALEAQLKQQHRQQQATTRWWAETIKILKQVQENPHDVELRLQFELRMAELRSPAAEEDSRNEAAGAEVEHLTAAQRARQLADSTLERPLDDTQAISLAQVYALIAVSEALKEQK